MILFSSINPTKIQMGTLIKCQIVPSSFNLTQTLHSLPKKIKKRQIQGQPLGFDTKYLALVDRNMQVRFSLKVVWESLVVGI